MEHKGLGIRKIVLEEMAKTNLPEPEFIESDDRFLVVLRFGG
jgi:predicted HTH transcriptional regulator